jgi:hypothetical protein
LLVNDQSALLDIYLRLMMKKKLTPLDILLRLVYRDNDRNHRVALDCLERGRTMGHVMRINYFYPLLVDAYGKHTHSKWTDDDRRRLFRLLDRSSVRIEFPIYASLVHRLLDDYFNGNVSSLLHILSTNKFEHVLDQLCRLLLLNTRHGNRQWSCIEQVAPFVRLGTRAQLNEFVDYLFSMVADTASK